MAVDGGPTDVEGFGDLGDGGASSQEISGRVGTLSCPYGGATEGSVSGPGGLQDGYGPLCGELALELSQVSDEVDHESAGGGGGVDRLVQAAQVDATLTGVGEALLRLSSIWWTWTPVSSVSMPATACRRRTGWCYRSVTSGQLKASYAVVRPSGIPIPCRRSG